MTPLQPLPILRCACDRTGKLRPLPPASRDWLHQLGLNSLEPLLPADHPQRVRACLAARAPLAAETLVAGRRWLWLYRPAPGAHEVRLHGWCLEESGPERSDQFWNLLQQMVDSLPERVFLRDAEGRVQAASGSFADSLGHTVESLRGMTLEELFPGTVEAGPANGWQRRTLGERVLLERTLSSLRDAAPGVLGIVRDREEWQRAEEERAFLAAIVDSSEDAIIGLRPDGAVCSWNRAAEALYGYRAADIIDQPATLLFLPERTDELPQLLRQVRRGERPQHVESLHLTAAGHVIAVALSTSAVRESDGDLLGAALIVRNITSRLRVEEDLRESEQKYRQLFAGSADAILLCDADTDVITEANAAARDLYGLPETTDWLRYGALVAAPAGPGTPLLHQRLDGRVFPAEETHSQFLWQGRTWTVHRVRDLSERQRLEQIRHSLAIAHHIQQQLLPQAPPRLPGYDMSARSLFCEATGGDYHDYLFLPDGRLLLAVGDVSGHGVGVSLLMGMLKGLLHAHALHCRGDLAHLFVEINRDLLESTDDSCFATLFVARLEPKTRQLWWNSAAQGLALLWRHRLGRMEELEPTGPPLGLFAGEGYPPSGPLALDAGDVLLVTTDGIWETRAPDGSIFGLERLKATLQRVHDAPAVGIRDALLAEMEEFRGGQTAGDDVTVLVLKALEGGPAG